MRLMPKRRKPPSRLPNEMGTKVEATEIAKVKCYRVTPKVVAAGKENHLIVHAHKGAYVFNAGMAATLEAILLADACKLPGAVHRLPCAAGSSFSGRGG